MIQFFETLPQFFSMKYPQLVGLIQEAWAIRTAVCLLPWLQSGGESVNASLIRNASVRRPEPSHRHSMLVPMVSVPPDWGHGGQHRVARWWLRPPYLGFHLWSWGLVARVVVWPCAVVPNLRLNWNRQNRQMLHSHTTKSATKHVWLQKY